MRGSSTVLVVGLAVLGSAGTPPARAQGDLPVVDFVEDIDFDRPEAWAMQYFGSVAMMTPIGPPRAIEPGSVAFAIEVTQVPQLSAAERTVGSNGINEQDLNRLPVFVRPRVTVGLPHRFAVEIGYVPPLRVDGVEPNLLSLAIARELHAGERWSLGARLHGQIGEVEGDLTCQDDDASFEPGTPGNLQGCLAASDDTTTLDHLGLHLGAGYQLGGARGSTLLFGAGVIHHDLEFEADAFTYDIHDRTRLRADGTTWAVDAGISVPASQRADLGVEVLWSPLEVIRPPRTTTENDDLIHVKALLRYRVR
jgi:hypothetical protein